jgi:hypothetical protein
MFVKAPPQRPLFNDSPGCMSRDDFFAYLRAKRDTSFHLVFRLGGLSDTSMFLSAAAECAPQTMLWEFSPDDSAAEIRDAMAILSSVPSVTVNFSDGRITSARVEVLCEVANDRYSRDLEFSAFDMMPAAFRDMLEVISGMTERFKTALVCIVACNK